MRVARLGLIATLSLSLLATPAHASQPVNSTESAFAEVRSLHLMERPDVLRLQKQMKIKGTMPPAYWWDVAQCETRRDWKDGGRWGGGLGIAVTTWTNYGGREFASHPSRATIAEQMYVANRVAITGFQTKRTFLTMEDRLNNRPFFRPRAGFFGWGCIANNRYLHPDRWRKNHRRVWRASKKDVLSTLWKPSTSE